MGWWAAFGGGLTEGGSIKGGIGAEARSTKGEGIGSAGGGPRSCGLSREADEKKSGVERRNMVRGSAINRRSVL